MIKDFGQMIEGAAKDALRYTAEKKPAAVRSAVSLPKTIRIKCYRDRQTGELYAVKDGDRAERKLRVFQAIEEMRTYRDQPDAHKIWQADWELVRDAGNVTDAKLRREKNSPRSGTDYRSGLDVSPEGFLSMFSPFGVQFGNWQTDRAECLNKAYDALIDLCLFLELNFSDAMLGGRLGLAFGARGKGKAAAHYEPLLRVINLTKTSGAGCLAHEWFHAYDHLLGEAEGGKYASESPYNALLLAMPRTLRLRCVAADKTRSKRYYSLPQEIVARCFEAWVRSRVENDYLANIVSFEAFGPKACYPYPTPEEMPAVAEAFERLFKVSAAT